MRRRSRDEELRRVYQRHVGAVYAFLAYSVDAATAEDLTAGTFERVIRAWDRFDPALASERTWILTIARNLLTDHFRSPKNQRTISVDEYPSVLDHLEDDAGWDRSILDQAELQQLLRVLQPRERELLALRYGADLSAEQTADLMNLTADNVHQITSRALKKLRGSAQRTSR